MEYILEPGNGGINLEATLGCGQVFQWTCDSTGWLGVVSGSAVRVQVSADGLLCETALPAEQIRAYFRLDDDLDAIVETFPDDAAMQEAVAAFRGLRIVQQDLWECLLSFICATNANIPRIQKMIRALCRAYGSALEGGLHAFPEPERLAAVREDELRTLGLGYRAGYVLGTAQMVAEGRFDMGAFPSGSYEGDHERLTALPGVGPKVADCVCLFSLGWLQAVPVDTWIRRMVQTRAPSLRTYRAMANYARAWLGPFAGYAQQYLFHYERTMAGRSCERPPASRAVSAR